MLKNLDHSQCSIPCASGKKCAQISEMPSFCVERYIEVFFHSVPPPTAIGHFSKGGIIFKQGTKQIHLTSTCEGSPSP